MVQIGISIEPLADLVQQTPAALHTAPTATDLALFSQARLLCYCCWVHDAAQRTVESLFHYACSFSTTPEQVCFQWNARCGSCMQTFERLQAGEEFIPISVLNRWHESYLAKLARDPFFWRNTSSD